MSGSTERTDSMLTYKLRGHDSGSISYDYYPEDGPYFRTVVSDAATGDLISRTLAPNDLHGVYLGHMVGKIADMIVDGELSDHGMIAWG